MMMALVFWLAIILAILLVIFAKAHDTHKVEPEVKPEPEPEVKPEPSPIGCTIVAPHIEFLSKCTISDNRMYNMCMSPNASPDDSSASLCLESVCGVPIVGASVGIDDPMIYAVASENVPDMMVRGDQVSGVSFSVAAFTANNPNITMRRVDGETFYCTVEKSKISHITRSTRGIFVANSMFAETEIEHHEIDATLRDSKFGSLTVDSHECERFALLRSTCNKVALTLHPDSIATILDSKLGGGKITGHPKSLVLNSSDLTGIKINVKSDDLLVSRCIGNGTTIRHLIIDDIVVNWTYDRVYVFNGKRTIRIYLDAIQTLIPELSTNGLAAEAGWIVDYILDHPAEPMTGEH